jgi:A/G-specific adenine glycosylase
MKVRTPSRSDGPGRPIPDVLAIRRALHDWHAVHARPLRFRGTTDAWLVLVAEVMAQQTQISRVEGAWATFVDRFPTPRACASATTADVLRAWAGLGYNRRAVQLHRAAQAIVDDHAGKVPAEVDLLETLPGVGPYTARAVAAIAFGRPVAAVDTNIRRLVGRLVGTPDATPRAVQSDADSLVDPSDPAAWTHAAMDLGASVCVARAPRCGACPLSAWCRTTAVRHAPAASPPRHLRPLATGEVRFETTSRWLRGRIVAALRDLDRDAWATPPTAIGGHDAASIAVAVEALVRDGLVERRGDGALRLPGASGPLPGASGRLPGAS